jgi:hypothetical protein
METNPTKPIPRFKIKENKNKIKIGSLRKIYLEVLKLDEKQQIRIPWAQTVKEKQTHQ